MEEQDQIRINFGPTYVMLAGLLVAAAGWFEDSTDPLRALERGESPRRGLRLIRPGIDVEASSAAGFTALALAPAGWTPLTHASTERIPRIVRTAINL